MTERVNKLYKPAEIKAAIDALQKKHFTEQEAIDIIKGLYALDFRIVYVGKVGE